MNRYRRYNMKQQTFTDIEYSKRKRKTKREQFLEIMDQIIPWQEWIEIIRPYYPSGKRGRPPRGIELMLRMYLLQIWFSLSDEGLEDSIYDSYAMRSFLRIDFTSEQVPDATTLLKFRHLLEQNGIGEKILADINYRLDVSGLMMHGGTVIDATLIAAPSSTKNAENKRDPEMHQSKKGNQWYFGMKIHAGVDAGSGYVHTITATSGNQHDITEAHQLIREDDEVVYADSGYLGLEKRPEIKENTHLSQVEYRINKKPSQLKMNMQSGIQWDKRMENRKSSIRCKVEHSFLIVKRQFGYAKVVYRGLQKNLHRFQFLFASANLLMCARAGRTSEFKAVRG